MTARPPSQQQSRLLSLPRELRDEIYFHYLQEPKGYVHTPITNKLRCSDGRAIDLSFMRTCKMVANELRVLPLRVNEVAFKPFLETRTSSNASDTWSAWSQAGKFDFLLDRLHFLQEEVFGLAATAYGSKQLERDIMEHFPNSCIGDVLSRISKYENEAYVPLMAVMGDSRSLTYHDREVLQDSLPSLTSHADLTERIRSLTCCMDILGFSTPLKARARGAHLIPRHSRTFILDRLIDFFPVTKEHVGRPAN